MVYIVVHSGTKKSRLKNRYHSLNRYVNKELRGPGEKGKVYDFSEWADTKVDRERNGSKMKETKEIKREFKKKGDEL